MASKISYFILFGILSITKGTPGYYGRSSGLTSELQRLLQDLTNQQGKYDIALSHHEDGPKTHHEDKARISLHDDKYNARHGDHLHDLSHERQGSYDNRPSLTNIQSLNLFYRKKPATVSKNNDDDDVVEKLQSQAERVNCNNLVNCNFRDWAEKSKGRSRDNEKIEYENVDEVLEFLSELDKNLEGNYNSGSDLRCSGNRCGRYNLRCRGNNCARSRDEKNDDDRDEKNNLRCTGDRCARNRDDRNDEGRDDRNYVRCIGDRCSGNRDDDDRDDRNYLRCAGDKCGRNRDNRYDDDRDDRDDLRCAGDKCARSRDDRDDDDDRDYREDREDRENREDLRCNGDRCGKNRDDREDKEYLRCIGDRCGINRDDTDRTDLRCVGDRCNLNRNDRLGDDRNDDKNDDRNDRDNRCAGDRCGRNRDDDDRLERDNLRCRGNKCARSRYDDDDDDDNDRLYESQRRPKQYKISDDLEAVVLDVSDLDRLLSNLNVRKNKLRGAKLLENVDLENLLSYTSNNDKKSNVEAVVFDLDKEKDRNSLSKQIKRILLQGNLSLK